MRPRLKTRNRRVIDGKLIVGQKDDERYLRWDACDDLAQQLVAKARNRGVHSTRPRIDFEPILVRMTDDIVAVAIKVLEAAHDRTV